MPNSVSSACSRFAASTASLRHAFSPAGLPDAIGRARLHGPVPMQLQRCADQSVQRRRPRLLRDGIALARNWITQSALRNDNRYSSAAPRAGHSLQRLDIALNMRRSGARCRNI